MLLASIADPFCPDYRRLAARAKLPQPTPSLGMHLDGLLDFPDHGLPIDEVSIRDLSPLPVVRAAREKIPGRMKLELVVHQKSSSLVCSSNGQPFHLILKPMSIRSPINIPSSVCERFGLWFETEGRVTTVPSL